MRVKLCIVFKARGALSNRTLTTAQQRNKIQERPVKGKQFYSNWSQDQERREIKLQRAQGGCPGTIRRRRTWQAAKSYGEPQAGIDP